MWCCCMWVILSLHTCYYTSSGCDCAGVSALSSPHTGLGHVPVSYMVYEVGPCSSNMNSAREEEGIKVEEKIIMEALIEVGAEASWSAL